MRVLSGLALAALAPMAALADVVPVQIGELDDATRLMLTIPVGAGWSAVTEDGRVRISVDGAEGFETSAFDDLTGKSRVTQAFGGLTADVLNIGLSCDCIARGYLISDRFLAVDVSDREPPATELTFADVLPTLTQPWHSQPAVAAAPRPPVSAPSASLPADVLDMAVTSGLARATYDGFLQLRDDAETISRPDIAAELLENIAIGVEAQLQTLTENAIPLPGAITFDCVGVEQTLANAWQDTQSFSLQRGAAHRNLSAEDDAPDPAGQRNLAIVLIGHGFGVEATAVLRDLGTTDDLTTALLFMADVLDGPHPPEPVGMETCGEALGFWPFLADPEGRRDSVDPRSLMITFKLMPPPLQSRLVDSFADALARAGYQSFQAELQDFRNVAMAIDHTDPATPPPVLDFETPASARDILRADLTASDLNPDMMTSRSPKTLPLDVLETLLVERRSTAAEPVLLDEVLTRHVAGGDYVAVVALLVDAASRLDTDTANRLTDRHLTAAVAGMTDPELIAFAFRETLPPLPETLKSGVRSRLRDLQITPPPIFASGPVADAGANDPVIVETDPAESFALPALVRIPAEGVPTFAQSQDLLDNAAAMRTTIETLIDDIN